ncbi:translation initiation factor IF-5A [Candidatus Woesearchaeota archaeon]|jgi:translation initiation factor 5A|nr:translation initiation factor IF-5A [Candidatus Woesearchaeota archaeon]MBT4387671.1 translation initiation factor IF-5A [Candidatus Woesearchaeota archaeon]MBT4595966.1 translation initiation factor IF-5A [Candidatus Woesearchaeota archaeon]MBT5741096.1 translation initiation factor IF-5A [Candidatus Woesearchaeota archaeon]MBT7296202.1 translation initiation factor IF-5A [Candidatus Woesearchaeota archaeon]
MGVKLVAVGQLTKGKYVVLDGAPCRVKSTSTSRPGKHGHSKVRLEGVGLLDGKTRVIVMPAHDNIEAPIVEKLTAQVLSVNGDMANVMDNETYETFDLKIDDDVEGEVVEGCLVLYWDLMGTKVMKQVKTQQEQDI